MLVVYLSENWIPDPHPSTSHVAPPPPRTNLQTLKEQQGIWYQIDLLAILQKSLDRALFLYIFIHEIRSSGVRASITIVHIRKFYKM